MSQHNVSSLTEYIGGGQIDTDPAYKHIIKFISVIIISPSRIHIHIIAVGTVHSQPHFITCIVKYLIV